MGSLSRRRLLALSALVEGCTLMRKHADKRVEVVLPPRSCLEADNVTFFRGFTWDSVGGRIAEWPYEGSPYPEGSYDVSSWEAVRALDVIKLNFGGGRDKHPRANFEGYVAVEALGDEASTMGGHCAASFPWCGSHCVCYDAAKPLPLGDATVAHILCEHVLEHIPETRLPALLEEFHRVLRPGGWARVAVPDYGHPRHAPLRDEGLRLGLPDATNPRHVTFTDYALVERLAYGSSFEGAVFYEYYGGDAATPALHRINFDKGLVKRSARHAAPGRKAPRSSSVVFDLVKRDAAGASRERIADGDRMLRYYDHPSFGAHRKRRAAHVRAEHRNRGDA